MYGPYRRAPITEAVIAVSMEKTVPRTVVEKAASRLKKKYPRSENRRMVSIKLGPANTQGGSQWIGLQLSSRDQTDVVILQQDGFLASRRAPYTGWEKFRERTEVDWNIWRKAGAIGKIKRIGVRFINRIDVPVVAGEQISIEDYLKVTLRLPQLPWEPISSYTMQVVRQLHQDRLMVILNSGSAQSPLIGHLSFLLDIDVYQETELPERDEQVWALIERIRTLKNEIFEACITDAARALFNT